MPRAALSIGMPKRRKKSSNGEPWPPRHLDIVAAQLRASLDLDADRHHRRLDLLDDVGEADRARGVHALRMRGCRQAGQAVGRGRARRPASASAPRPATVVAIRRMRRADKIRRRAEVLVHLVGPPDSRGLVQRHKLSALDAKMEGEALPAPDGRIKLW